MIYYTQTPDFYNEYIAHYGVKGMKWGVRKRQLIESGVSKRLARRQVRLEKRAAKQTEKSNAWGNSINAARLSNYKKRQEKYKTKMQKYSKHHSADKVKAKQNKYNEKLKLFDQTTKDLTSAKNKYNKIVNDYTKLKIQSLSDKSVKKSDTYKKARNAYADQRFYDLNYGYGDPGSSHFRYASDAQRARKKKTGKYYR